MCGSEREGLERCVCVSKQSRVCIVIVFDTFGSCRSGVPSLPAMDLLGTGLHSRASSGWVSEASAVFTATPHPLPLTT